VVRVETPASVPVIIVESSTAHVAEGGVSWCCPADSADPSTATKKIAALEEEEKEEAANATTTTTTQQPHY